jgi:hypothetical protein
MIGQAVRADKDPSGPIRVRLHTEAPSLSEALDAMQPRRRRATAWPG